MSGSTLGFRRWPRLRHAVATPLIGIGHQRRPACHDDERNPAQAELNLDFVVRELEEQKNLIVVFVAPKRLSPGIDEVLFASELLGRPISIRNPNPTGKGMHFGWISRRHAYTAAQCQGEALEQPVLGVDEESSRRIMKRLAIAGAEKRKPIDPATRADTAEFEAVEVGK